MEKMPCVREALDEVSRLLDEVVGITVLDRRIDGDDAVLGISSQSVTSTHQLQRLCTAANVALEPPLRARGVSTDADALGHFSIHARYQGFDVIESGHLQLLGIHLVWHLHGTGSLSTEAANTLLQRWKGAQVGA